MEEIKPFSEKCLLVGRIFANKYCLSERLSLNSRRYIDYFTPVI